MNIYKFLSDFRKCRKEKYQTYKITPLCNGGELGY